MKANQGKCHKGYDLIQVEFNFRQMQGISERRKALIDSLIHSFHKHDFTFTMGNNIWATLTNIQVICQ